MKEAYEFLKKAGTFYLATMEGDQARVRPFGAVSDYDGKLYITTNNQKEVYRQLKANPKTEICAMVGGQWMRISGVVEEDDSREARKAMLDANPSLRSMYNEDDNLMTVFYFKCGRAVLSSFTEAPAVCEW